MVGRACPFVLVLAAACVVGGDASTGSGTDSTGASTTGGATGSGGTAGTASGATSEASGATGVVDECPSRPGGGWNACRMGAQIDNKLCEWSASAGKNGTVTCLSPASGGLNVCGIEGCVEDCDCFAPPATGTAVVTCAPILGDGGKACALYCAGGQTCPDGMQCASGYCYWPDT